MFYSTVTLYSTSLISMAWCTTGCSEKAVTIIKAIT